jgi:hypothetical protein
LSFSLSSSHERSTGGTSTEGTFPSGLSAPVDGDYVDRVAGALLLVELAGDREMVGDVVAVVEDVEELALGLAVVGV